MKAEQELLNQKTLRKTLNKTINLNITKLSKKSLLNDSRMSRLSRISKSTNKSLKDATSLKKPMYNYVSFLDENEFIPKHKELKLLIDNTNDYIGKCVFDLANSTKETNEKIKKLINNK